MQTTQSISHLRECVENLLANDDTEEAADSMIRLAHSLETALEQDGGGTELGNETLLLNEIANTYKRIALTNLVQHKLVHYTMVEKEPDLPQWLECLGGSNLQQQDSNVLNEELAEYCLDWATASKRADNMWDCFYAHLLRMKLCPKYQIMDAVRLLGLQSKETRDHDSDKDSCVVDIESIPRTGLFENEARRVSWMTGDSHHASKHARAFGKSVRALFAQHQYSFRNCRSTLVPLIESTAENATDPERIFSGNTFFQYRCELAFHDENQSKETTLDGLQILTRLFLFGLSIDRATVERAIGKNELELLVSSRLATVNPTCSTHVVGEVQVFPISQHDLFGAKEDDLTRGSDQSCNKVQKDESFLFATDWPMESLRITRDAVMAVGDDTLELMALLADGGAAFGGRRLLDLCCGCGIQGIFASGCHNNKLSSSAAKGKGYHEVVFADINERACHFVTANVALNGIGTTAGYKDQQDKLEIYAVQSDLYEKLRHGAHDGETVEPSVARFDRIVSNPPFVAIPHHPALHALPQTAPALYAIGGGVDGTQLLERIVRHSFEVLNSKTSCLIMVTEVPNVESSCEFLERFIPQDEKHNTSVRISYVARDVESVQGYAAAREDEAPNDIDSRDWALPQTNAGVQNRALVLIVLSHNKDNQESGLFPFDEDRDDKTRKGDESCFEVEEDLFLTRKGVSFARSRLFLDTKTGQESSTHIP